jgi:hypothetical protein
MSTLYRFELFNHTVRSFKRLYWRYALHGLQQWFDCLIWVYLDHQRIAVEITCPNSDLAFGICDISQPFIRFVFNMTQTP